MGVELKKWDIRMKQDLIRICNGADRTYLSEKLPYPYTENDAEQWLCMVSEREGKSGVSRAVVYDGVVVGEISVEQKTDVYCKDAEIGYFLLADYWSKGIMTEAVKLICGEAFAGLDIIRITGLVYAPNIASQKVLEKNGFALEGIQKKAVFKNGALYDLYIYGRAN